MVGEAVKIRENWRKGGVKRVLFHLGQNEFTVEAKNHIDALWKARSLVVSSARLVNRDALKHASDEVERTQKALQAKTASHGISAVLQNINTVPMGALEEINEQLKTWDGSSNLNLRGTRLMFNFN